MAILSKFLGAKPLGVVEGNDYHIWIENNEGEVVYDPPMEKSGFYETICKIRDCDIKKPYYYEWSNQKKHLDEQYVDEMINENIYHSDLNEFYKRPQPRYCRSNAIGYYINQTSQDNLRIVIGSFGWEKRDGTIWWEFG